MRPGTRSARLLMAYYAATAAFVLLDLGFDINVRVAFLEPWPLWRLVYYGMLFGCFALMLRVPGWGEVIAGLESLLTLVALILSFGVRATAGGAVIDGEFVPIRLEEVVNFLLSGFFAYFSWVRGGDALRKRLG